ncbi:hypothetical protein PLICRDRAFT_373056 [Plicaturopsis crispa FD-325 SS-3]|uniref:Major facilitator superfamily (MFS) profile domain-containing protein n=1 Tax=Plicaturopsis crispa FD-325 SS-3 TaxID=944288 RepID=A0A0C9SKQ9_PLICR|nr:hypothetical protein PLICRDRAFT_373056 [Plicaturopsis crispa FD-325 SS-3]
MRVDVESVTASAHSQPSPVDIEHEPVAEDDPRLWSTFRKRLILIAVSFASLIATQAANIQNPGVMHIEEEMNASSSEVSWSLSVFILLQGLFPFIWSAVSEIKGRKIVYLTSMTLFTIGSTAVALAPTMPVVIGMRCIEGAGGSAVFAIGAATLADIYEVADRGSVMGLYHAAPSLGRALAPLLGGALSQGFSWRAIYWDLVIFGSVLALVFLLFYKDTFRRERSLTYQLALSRREKDLMTKRSVSERGPPRIPSPELPPAIMLREIVGDSKQYNLTMMTTVRDDEASRKDTVVYKIDLGTVPPGREVAGTKVADLQLSFRDVNPLKPLWRVLRRVHNLAILTSSALIFGFFYSISYTTGRTLGRAYGYNSLEIGLVLFNYGIGTICGSLLGGKWSDVVVARMTHSNGGRYYPEMRLQSTKIMMPLLPFAVAGYAWSCQKHLHIAAICIMLFLAGFFSMWIYSSTLSYIVDANTGRSSMAVAADGLFRGIAAFVAAEIAIPLQDNIGDGGLYTMWAALLLVGELLILMTIRQGSWWRERSQRRDEMQGN